MKHDKRMKCDRDCFNCKFDDCILDKATPSDLDEFNYIEEYAKNEKVFDKIASWEGDQSECKTKFDKYNHSFKGYLRTVRYNQSEKGKAKEMRKRKKRIESGRNAEACRRYRERKKLLKGEN